MVYSGVTEGRVKVHSMTVMNSEEWVEEVRCISERLMKARLRVENGRVTVVQV